MGFVGSDSSKNSSSLFIGVLIVALGASCYGMLSTFVKMAYHQGFTTAEVTTAQFGWGLVLLTALDFFTNRRGLLPTWSETGKLMLAGIPLALTSVFYYVSVRFIDASIAVVLLMQVVWIGVFIEAIVDRKLPSSSQVFGVVFVLFGTLLATNVLGHSPLSIDPRGLFFGFLSAITFATTLYGASRVAVQIPAAKRSQIMIFGGFFVVLGFAALTQLFPYYLGLELLPAGFTQVKAFDFQTFLSYGFLVAVFGTFIPPILLNKGFPIVGVGLGSIVSSLELPCAMIIAYLFLGEIVNSAQWLGVAIILGAIVLINLKLVLPQRASDSRDVESLG